MPSIVSKVFFAKDFFLTFNNVGSTIRLGGGGTFCRYFCSLFHIILLD